MLEDSILKVTRKNKTIFIRKSTTKQIIRNATKGKNKVHDELKINNKLRMCRITVTEMLKLARLVSLP